MINSLRGKLVLSYLGIALLTAVLIFVLIRVTADQRLKAFVQEQQISQLQEILTSWYETEGSWDGVEQYFLSQLHANDPLVVFTNNDIAQGKHGVVDLNYQVLIPYRAYWPGETLPTRFLTDAVPVVVAGQTVGWIVPDTIVGVVLSPDEQLFLQNTNRALLLAGGISVALALLTALVLARVLIRPIAALTQASELMAEGDLKQEVAIHSRDELGRLAASFNSMSQQVALSNERRRHLTAAIAHDLSTPLHIISGYVELILDGELEPTPARMNIIATELEQLGHLIRDLDVLALTDTNRLEFDLEPLLLSDYLPRVVASFQQMAVAKAIDLSLDIPEPVIGAVQIDRERMGQVLGNLLNNSLRHTPVGGAVQVALKQAGTQVIIEVVDNGVGIPDVELPFLFDRFYQVDKSRGQRGKIGLGLAISKGLVEAMGGEISVSSRGDRCGATFRVTLPIYEGGMGIE